MDRPQRVTQRGGPSGLGERAFAALRRRRSGLPPPGLVARIGSSTASRRDVAQIPRDAVVLVPFGGLREHVYQLDQWLPVLEDLDGRHKVLLLIREADVLHELQDRTKLPLVGAPAFPDLMRVFERVDAKVALYVNNSMRNFQALNNARMLHVHVGHGESDKPPSYSNQAKAYDRVFIAGPAAVQRYRRALMGFDESKLVTVGRPQLDLSFDPVLPATERRTVVYAPTWEGVRSTNHLTSLAALGVRIAEQVLATPGVRFVYRPHPQVPRSPDPGVASAHQRITTMIRVADAASPDAGHAVSLTRSPIPVLRAADVLVGDLSSVTLDYLYLRPDGPIFFTDPEAEGADLVTRSALATAADVVDPTSVGSLGALLDARLSDDVRRTERGRARQHYFGDLAPGESTSMFHRAIDDLVAERDRELARLQARALEARPSH